MEAKVAQGDFDKSEIFSHLKSMLELLLNQLID